MYGVGPSNGAASSAQGQARLQLLPRSPVRPEVPDDAARGATTRDWSRTSPTIKKAAAHRSLVEGGASPPTLEHPSYSTHRISSIPPRPLFRILAIRSTSKTVWFSSKRCVSTTRPCTKSTILLSNVGSYRPLPHPTSTPLASPCCITAISVLPISTECLVTTRTDLRRSVLESAQPQTPSPLPVPKGQPL